MDSHGSCLSIVGDLIGKLKIDFYLKIDVIELDTVFDIVRCEDVGKLTLGQVGWW